jgi:hypothetical protein
LEVDARTVRRWVLERPELRSVLRARRNGKHWRIDYPRAPAEYDAWIEEVRNAVSQFTRKPERTSEFVKSVCEFLGFGDRQRDMDIEILRHAMLLKRADAEQNVAAHERDEFHAHLDGERSANLPNDELAEWEGEATSCCSTARMVSGYSKCRVQEAPEHWAEFCRKQRDENVRYNAPKENWLKEHGLWERANQLLPEHERPGELVAFIGRLRADGKPRIKLYRCPPVCDYAKDNQWREVHFLRETIQLLRVETDEEIQTEVRRVKELWPKPQHWKRAKEQREQDWRMKTLCDATLELLRDDKFIIGANLAPLLFRNVEAQDCWKVRQEHLELRGRGIEVFPNEAAYRYGKRGISLREFRDRYSRQDIAKAREIAADALRPQQAESLQKVVEDSGMSLLDKYGKPIPTPFENRDFTVGKRRPNRHA